MFVFLFHSDSLSTSLIIFLMTIIIFTYICAAYIRFVFIVFFFCNFLQNAHSNYYDNRIRLLFEDKKKQQIPTNKYFFMTKNKTFDNVAELISYSLSRSTFPFC